MRVNQNIQQDIPFMHLMILTMGNCVYGYYTLRVWGEIDMNSHSLPALAWLSTNSAAALYFVFQNFSNFFRENRELLDIAKRIKNNLPFTGMVIFALLSHVSYFSGSKDSLDFKNIFDSIAIIAFNWFVNKNICKSIEVNNAAANGMRR